MGSPESLATINWVVVDCAEAGIDTTRGQHIGTDAITASLTSAPLFTYNVDHIERRPERKLGIKVRMVARIVPIVIRVLSDIRVLSERLASGRSDGVTAYPC